VLILLVPWAIVAELFSIRLAFLALEERDEEKRTHFKDEQP
jgi:hypothetical protein